MLGGVSGCQLEHRARPKLDAIVEFLVSANADIILVLRSRQESPANKLP
jgi:hypothetical protein